MKKLFKKIIAFMLLASSVCAVAGCKKEQNSDENNKSAPIIGTHEFKVSETNDKLLENGATEYQILLPSSATLNEELAATELTYFFKEATGISLHTLKESASIKAESGKYISIGKTSLLQQHADKVDATILGKDGVRIFTIGDDVFLCGASDNGTLYSVYEFLHQTVGFEFLSNDTYLLDENVKTISLMDYDITDVPDVVRRASSSGYVDSNASMLRRLRLSCASNSIYSTGNISGGTHNTLEFFADETDPDYFGANGAQICYAAHGNPEKLEKMIKIVGDQMIDALIKNPDTCELGFTQEDNFSWCSCDVCSASSAKYGTDAAIVIKFMNKLKLYIDAWMETTEGAPHKRDITLLFFAYNSTTIAPVVWDETSKSYKPMDDEVRCVNGVGVFYAPIQADFTKSFYDEDNKTYYENMIAWTALTDRMWLWHYGTNFKAYMYPYNTIHSLQDIISFSVQCGAKLVFVQCQHNDIGMPTGWQVLQQYLTAKWMWNVNYELNDLLDSFFEGYFGDAADTMRTYFNECDQHTFNLIQAGNEAGYSGLGSIYKKIDNEKCFPKQLMKKWYAYCNQALTEIEDLQESNVILYNNIKSHILAERLFPLYALCTLYTNAFSEEGLLSMRLQFKEDALALGKMRDREGGSLQTIYQNWGID